MTKHTKERTETHACDWEERTKTRACDWEERTKTRACDWEERTKTRACDCISRPAVLESLETDCSLIMFDSYGNLTFAGERIIEVIKGMPSVEQEKCGDLISRETATHYLTKARLLGDSRPMKEIFAEIPSVEPERKPGKWLPVPKGNTIIISDEMADISLRLPTSLCSNCGEVVPVIGKWKRYCPMCGLKMEVSNDT